jgi:hypothetical protein
MFKKVYFVLEQNWKIVTQKNTIYIHSPWISLGRTSFEKMGKMIDNPKNQKNLHKMS